jgi:predicted PurR-regulated permease PerM
MMSRPERFSYAFIFLLLIVVGWLHLATPLLTALFAYFALNKLSVLRSRWLTVLVFLVLVLGVFYGFVLFLRQALIALPHVASTSIPMIIDYAKAHQFDLPFEDLDSLRAFIIDRLRHQLSYVGNFARIATKEFVFLVIGLVVAVSLFLDSKVDLERERYRVRNNLYSLCCEQIVERFRLFYSSFVTVMGAQILISLINTLLTSIFIFSVQLPYAPVVVGVTFLAGLLPIVGNLISNTIIVGIAFTRSPQLAIAALVFLVVLHKLEYLLNSKIIGERIKNPIWLTLLALILGERLLGIPGMILAPVVLNYIRTEASRIEVVEPEHREGVVAEETWKVG